MKRPYSIKFKITFWYTLILTLVFAAVLGGVFLSSEIYSEEMVKTELLDEVKDLREEITRYPEHFPGQDYVSYYDDGVLLSVYDEEFQFLNGVLPDAFSVESPFLAGEFQTVQMGNESWFILDEQITLSNGTSLWIRGIHSFSSIVLMIQRLRLLLCFAAPLLILFTAFIGYRLVHRALHPVSVITGTANEIADSADLSLRLPATSANDEFLHLTETFNKMLNRLEQQFLREQEFSSDAAHELRTPVSVILSHCEYSLAELTLTPEIREEFLCIQEKALRMSQLVTHLLNIARAESNSFHPVFEDADLEILAEAAIDELEEKARNRGIQLELQSFLSSPVIQGNSELLSRLFLNLIDNGIQYGLSDGYVKVSMEQRGKNVLITVSDNGIGIQPECLDKIWNRFYRADSSRSDASGFGLGLFIVRYIVNIHKGTIHVESSPGKGTAFHICLPCGGIAD